MMGAAKNRNPPGSTPSHAGHEVAMGMRKAYLSFHRKANAALAPIGITADQFVVLNLLVEHGDANQKWIVAQAGSDPNTMSRLIRTLEENQLVVRAADPSDGRAVRVSVTVRGQAVVQRAATAISGLHQRLAELVSGEGGPRFLETLRAIEAIAATDDPERVTP